MTTVLGLDIGGTHSRARLVRDGHTLAEATAGSASLTAAGAEPAAAALRDLLTRLDLDRHGLLDAVCAGSAGSGSQEANEFLQWRLAPLTRNGLVIIVNDARLALPAAGLDEGIAVISGTGSMCLGVWSGREAHAGGLGYLLGDEGSGYWVVRCAIRELASRRDREVALAALGECLLTATGAADLADLIQRFYDRHNPDGWAAHARVVLDCADPAAAQIRDAAARELTNFVSTVARTLSGPPDLPVALAGGLVAGHAALAQAVRTRLVHALPSAPVTVVTDPPVAGAVRLALTAAEG